MNSSLRVFTSVRKPCPIPLRVLLTFVTGILCFACGSAEESAALERWYEAVDEVELQQAMEAQQHGPLSPNRMRNDGFVHSGNAWLRAAKLTALVEATPLQSNPLRHVGAVSVLSIDRHNGEPPYLYNTLRSLLAELPSQAPINVFVGNDDLDYVRPQKLAQELGASSAAQICVWGSDAKDVAYMREAHFTVHERASWNYARMLRGYQGEGYHLTFEDDVVVSRGGLRVLDALLSKSSPPIVSLYNPRCERTPGAAHHTAGDGARLFGHRHDRSKLIFWGTQAVAYRGELSRHTGQHLQAHLGEKPFNLLLDRYMRTQRIELGYVLPSMVQHVGAITTGLGFHHVSSCFAENYPASGAASFSISE